MKSLRSTLTAAMMAAMLTSATTGYALEIEEVDFNASQSLTISNSAIIDEVQDLQTSQRLNAVIADLQADDDSVTLSTPQVSYSLQRIGDNLWNGTKDTVKGTLGIVANAGRIVRGLSRGVTGISELVFHWDPTAAAHSFTLAYNDLQTGGTNLPGAINQTKNGLVSLWEGAKEGAVATASATRTAIAAAQKGYAWVKSWF